MRFTLEPAGDVEVPEGLTLAECRPSLARLTGLASLTDAPLTIDGAVVPGAQVAGVPPWVAGSRLMSGPTVPDAVRLAAAAPWHLAVVTGPDAGAVAAPGRDGVVRVGREDRGLTLTDPTVSRQHLTVRGRDRGRNGPTWRVADTGSANGSVRVRWGRRRRVRHGLRVRPGDTVLVGATTVELRAGPGATIATGDGPEAAPPPPGVGVPLAGWLVPVVVSAGVAVMTGNPAFLFMGLSGPLGALLSTRRRRARPSRPADAPPDLGPDAAAASVGLARAADGPGPTPLPSWWQLARDGLAVCGSGAVARALVGAALAAGVDLTVLHPPHADADWRWCRWLGSRLGPEPRVAGDPVTAAAVLAAPSRTPHLVVVHGDGWRPALDRWWLGRRAEEAVLLVVDDRAEIPAWCRWVLTVGPDGAGTLSGARTWPVTAPAASAAWAEDHARRVAAHDAVAALRVAASGGAGAASGTLPREVALADLGVPGDATALRQAWSSRCRSPAPRHPGLVATIGVGGTGAVTVDLVRDGPHALVAGTTGSGKSELLQCLVLGLALRYPPTDLAILLVDYKGGTSFGPCPDLPHVVGLVTDLDPERAGRALDGLRTELARREAVLAHAGAADLEALPAGATGRPPRLLVVVDEFRALSEDLPGFVPGLVRLAAQGRSLGMHLVLATQRPAGAVNAQMRANLALRLCLRVTEAADSLDVVDVPDAAGLPADRPGRAVLRRGAGPVTLVQTAWAALGPRPDADVRTAADWVAFGQTPGPVRTRDHAAHLVRVAREAAHAAGIPRPAPLWTPPLPAAVRADALADGAPDHTDGLVLGVTDPAGGRAHGLLSWAGGVLAVAGRPGSGRTTTLATVAQAALARGWHVHVAAGTPAAAALVAGTTPPGQAGGRVPHPGVGTVVTADDPRRLARLLGLALSGEAPRLLVVDDVATIGRALDRVPRGAAADRLDRAVREGRHHGLSVVVAGAPADLVRLLPHAPDRLVLPVADLHDDVLLAVPRDLSGPRGVPGRAVYLSGEAVRCQVALPAPVTAVPPGHGEPPPRLAALPLHVRVPPPRPGAQHVVIGRGGDDAGPVAVGVVTGLLVVGPPGSGRSTALALLTRALRAAGQVPAVVARDGPVADRGRLGPAYAPGGAAARDLAHRLGAGRAGVLVVDDLDALARADPALDEMLTAWVVAADAGEPAPRIVAAARTDRAAVAYRGVCAALRAAGPVLVLWPATPGSAEVAGADLDLACDPSHPHHPGRGVLVHRGRLSPLQVASDLGGS